MSTFKNEVRYGGHFFILLELVHKTSKLTVCNFLICFKKIHEGKQKKEKHFLQAYSRMEISTLD